MTRLCRKIMHLEFSSHREVGEIYSNNGIRCSFCDQLRLSVRRLLYVDTANILSHIVFSRSTVIDGDRYIGSDHLVSRGLGG